MEELKMGTVVFGKYDDIEEWYEAEFLKYDEHMEYGKYICLTWSHDGKIVECFDRIRIAKEEEIRDYKYI